MSPFGEKIRALRAQNQLTLIQCARKAGLGKGHLSRLEHDPKIDPGLATLRRLAHAFNLTPAELLARIDG